MKVHMTQNKFEFTNNLKFEEKLDKLKNINLNKIKQNLQKMKEATNSHRAISTNINKLLLNKINYGLNSSVENTAKRSDVQNVKTQEIRNNSKNQLQTRLNKSHLRINSDNLTKDLSFLSRPLTNRLNCSVLDDSALKETRPLQIKDITHVKPNTARSNAQKIFLSKIKIKVKMNKSSKSIGNVSCLKSSRNSKPKDNNNFNNNANNMNNNINNLNKLTNIQSFKESLIYFSKVDVNHLKSKLKLNVIYGNMCDKLKNLKKDKKNTKTIQSNTNIMTESNNNHTCSNEVIILEKKVQSHRIIDKHQTKFFKK